MRPLQKGKEMFAEDPKHKGNNIRAGLRTMGALCKQQELGPRSMQARTVTPWGPSQTLFLWNM